MHFTLRGTMLHQSNLLWSTQLCRAALDARNFDRCNTSDKFAAGRPCRVLEQPALLHTGRHPGQRRLRICHRRQPGALPAAAAPAAGASAANSVAACFVLALDVHRLYCVCMSRSRCTSATTQSAIRDTLPLADHNPNSVAITTSETDSAKWLLTAPGNVPCGRSGRIKLYAIAAAAANSSTNVCQVELD